MSDMSKIEEIKADIIEFLRNGQSDQYTLMEEIAFIHDDLVDSEPVIYGCIVELKNTGKIKMDAIQWACNDHRVWMLA